MLAGEVVHTEQHGHETLVSVDVGARGVELDDTGRHSLRHGELVLRVPPDVRPAPGERIGVRLNLDQLHYFDIADGRRIGPGARR